MFESMEEKNQNDGFMNSYDMKKGIKSDLQGFGGKYDDPKILHTNII